MDVLIRRHQAAPAFRSCAEAAVSTERAWRAQRRWDCSGRRGATAALVWGGLLLNTGKEQERGGITPTCTPLKRESTSRTGWHGAAVGVNMIARSFPAIRPLLVNILTRFLSGLD